MICRWIILRQTLMVAYESFQAKILNTSSVAPLFSGFLRVSEMFPLLRPISLSWPWDATPCFMREAPLNTDFAALQQSITAAGWSSSVHSERGGLPTPCQGRVALSGGSSIVAVCSDWKNIEYWSWNSLKNVFDIESPWKFLKSSGIKTWNKCTNPVKSSRETNC